MSLETDLSTLVGRTGDILQRQNDWADAQVALAAGRRDDPASFNSSGGKTGPLGYYPIRNVNGQTLYMPCLDRLSADYQASLDAGSNTIPLTERDYADAAQFPAGSAGKAIDDRVRKDRQRVNILDYRYAVDASWDGPLARAQAVAGPLNRDVYLPGLVGGYKFLDRVNLAYRGARLVGDGHELSQIRVYSDFHMTMSDGAGGTVATDAIVRILTTASGSGAGLIDIGIVCDQPLTNLRSAMIKYPWALRFTSVARCVFRGVRIYGAWNGVDASGNTGGLDLGMMEIGAVNWGLLLDGAQDFVTGHLRFWPWGFDDATRKQAYQDGSTIGLRCGACDGFSISLDTFGPRTQFFYNAQLLRGAFGCIPRIQYDGNRSRAEGYAQFLIIGGLYKSSSLADDFSFQLTGGTWCFAAGVMFGATSGTTPMILNAGANVLLGPMAILEGSPDAPIIRQTAGSISAPNLRFLFGSNTTRTAPFIEITGGDADIRSPQFREKGSGGGPGVRITNNGRHNIQIGKCDWGIELPTAISNGNYTLDTVFTATPTAQFFTNGDFAPAYSAPNCWTKYQVIANRVHFTMRLEATFAHSTADGALRILTGIPYLPVDPENLHIGGLNNVNFGVTMVTADIDVTGIAYVRKTASGGTRAFMGATTGGGGEFPSNGATKSIILSGSFKA